MYCTPSLLVTIVIRPICSLNNSSFNIDLVCFTNSFIVLCVCVCVCRKDLERLQPLESHSVQELIQRELERERMRLEAISLQHKEK